MTNSLSQQQSMLVSRKRSPQPSRMRALQDAAEFTCRLARLMGGGLPFLPSLEHLAQHECSPEMRGLECQLIHAIEEGCTFSEALARYPDVFDSCYATLVHNEEQDQTLAPLLSQLASILYNEARSGIGVAGAMIYAVAVAAVAALLGLVLVLQAWPVLRAGCIGFIATYPLIASTSGVAITVGLVEYFRTGSGRRFSDRCKFRLPVFGPVLCKIAVERCLRVLGMLLSSGASVLQALRVLEETSENVVVSRAVAAWRKSVEEGGAFLAPLAPLGILSASSSWLSDQSDRPSLLPGNLLRVADELQEQVDDALFALRTVVSPVLVLVLTVLTACLVVVVCGLAVR